MSRRRGAARGWPACTSPCARSSCPFTTSMVMTRYLCAERLAADPELSHLALQRTRLQTKQRRGAVDSIDLAARRAQRFLDRVAHRALEARTRRLACPA